MKALLQRVSQAWVSLDDVAIGRIGTGMVVFVGVARGDSEKDAHYLAQKTINLRVFPDEEGKLNLSSVDIGGEFLVVSQFTLLANTKKGHRPSFVEAAPPEEAEPLFELYVWLLRASGLKVEKGIFREHLEVGIHNDGPVTILLNSRT